MTYRGVVTRATADGVWVRCAALAPGSEFGPLPTCDPTVTVGANVLLADLGEVSLPDLIVVGTISTGVTP